jgi:predicted aldo/keto reductase-like oxidoreductase
MKRRDFLKTAALGGAAIVLNKHARRGLAEEQLAAIRASSNPAKLPCRTFRDTDIPISIIGFSGLVLRTIDQDRCNRLIADAFERGVNYYDVAPRYGDAEVKMGPALEPYRKKVFLACKTAERTREGAVSQLKRSLERLRTDHFDLYQMHALRRVDKDVDAAFQKGGAMEVFDEAKKSGQVRYLGFSAHTAEAALAAMERYDFDSIMFPVNYASLLKVDFSPKVLDAAKSRGMAIMGIKPLVHSAWDDNVNRKEHEHGRMWYCPITDVREAQLGLNYSLSQGITAGLPPANETLFRRALDLGMHTKSIEEKEVEELKKIAASLTPLFPGP